MDDAGSIETERLKLRVPEQSQADELATIANAREVSERLATMPYPYARKDALSWIDAVAALKSGAAFTVNLKSSGKIIGCCGCGPVKTSDEIDFGYWIGVDYWGHGYATEAASAVLNHVLNKDRFEVITTDYQTDNLASARILEKLGFQVVGQRQSYCLAKQSDVETVQVQLQRHDWLQHHLCTIA